MPKNYNPSSQSGRQSTQKLTGYARAANPTEAAAGVEDKIYISPATLASAAPGLIPDATTAVEGKVSLASNAEAIAGTITSNKAIIPSSLTARLTSAASVTGASPQVSNNRIGQVVFSGVSIAADATQTFVITNSTIAGASTIIALQMYGCTTGAALSIQSYTPSAGSVSIVVANGTGATTSTADITFVFQVWG